MSRLVSIFVTSVAVVAIAAATCSAGFDVFVGDFVKLINGPGSPGGIFHVNVLGRGTDEDFDTMCVELTEYINFNTTYYVDGIGTTSEKSNKDLANMEGQGAWLYSEAHLGNLYDFDFATAGADKANALQLGIWRGVGWDNSTIQSVTGWSTSYIDNTLMPILQPWLDDFADDTSWSGVGNVRIMTLRKYVYVSSDYVGPGEIVTLANGKKIKLKDYAQDQLVWTNIVPELPTFYTMAGLLSCTALCGLFSRLRRRRMPVSVSAF